MVRDSALRGEAMEGSIITGTGGLAWRRILGGVGGRRKG